MDSHIHKQMHEVRYKSYVNLRELLHVAAKRSQHFSLGSTIDVLNLFPEDSTSLPKYVGIL